MLGLFARMFSGGGRAARATGGKATRAARPMAKKGGRGGLLGGAAGFGLGNLFANAGQQMEMSGADGGSGSGLGFAAAGRQNNMTSAAGATSALSDADSSDPVVRQLQDIERVLVSIKGDTANFVSGIGSKEPEAANKAALAAMFARKGGIADTGMGAAGGMGGLGKILGGLGAGLLALQGMNMAGDSVEEEEQTEADIKASTKAGSQERFDATIGDELLDVGATAGAKIGGSVAGTIGEKTAARITEKSTEKAADRMARSAVQTSTGGVRFDKAGNAINKAGQQIHGAAADAAKNSMEALQKAQSKVLKEGGQATAGVAAKIGSSIAKHIGAGAAKTLPFVGELFNMYFATEKMLKGDTTGAMMELGGAIPFAGVGLDVASLVRDVYKDVYDVFPEDEPGGLTGDQVSDRMAQITAMATEAMANLVTGGDEENNADALEAVPAVPEGTKQKRFDVTDPVTGAVLGSSDTQQGANQIATETGGVVQAGVEVDPIGAQMEAAGALSTLTPSAETPSSTPQPSVAMNNSAQVETASDNVTDTQKQSDQIVLSQALAGAIGSSNNTLPYQPEVSVNVTTPKTSLPNNNSELQFIGNNFRHLV